MGHFYRSLKFKNKIAVMLVGMLFIYSLITGRVYYEYSMDNLEDNFYSSSDDLVNQMEAVLYDKITAVTKKVHTIAGNEAFTVPLKNYYNNPDIRNRIILQNAVSNMISEMTLSDSLIHSAYIYTWQGGFYDYTDTIIPGFDYKKSWLYQYFEDHPYEYLAMFEAVPHPVFKGNETVIPFVYRFKLNDKYYYFNIFLDQSEIKNYLKETYSYYDQIFLYNEDEKLIADGNRSEAGLTSEIRNQLRDKKLEAVQSFKVIDNGEEYLCTAKQMPGTGWTICALKSFRYLHDNLRSLRFYILAASAAALFGIVLVSRICVLFLTKPLKNLSDVMQRAKGDGLKERFLYPYPDEIGALSESYNDMLDEINRLVDSLNEHIEALVEEKERVKEEQQKKKIAELKALQSQINPHFLYNTLNTITWQAVEHEDYETSRISSALGKFFRIVLSDGEMIIPVKKEVEHVTSYLEIQKIRYLDRFTYTIDIPEDLMNYNVIKLIIQPLVENSIYHGIKLKRQPGVITISARMVWKNGESCICFCVYDNGIGIVPHELEEMNRCLKSREVKRTDGYGIFNVNERIQLYYGEKYGLAYESVSGEWTKAVIVLPIVDRTEWEGQGG